MSEIARVMLLTLRVGIDLAKNLIQVHAVGAAGRRVLAKALKRDQFMAWCTQLPGGCLVAMEACSSAHHCACKLRSADLDERLIAAHLVPPYRMEGKSDATDAAAICEAASRPSMPGAQSRKVQVSAPSKRLTTTDSWSFGSKLRRFTP